MSHDAAIHLERLVEQVAQQGAEESALAELANLSIEAGIPEVGVDFYHKYAEQTLLPNCTPYHRALAFSGHTDTLLDLLDGMEFDSLTTQTLHIYADTLQKTHRTSVLHYADVLFALAKRGCHESAFKVCTLPIMAKKRLQFQQVLSKLIPIGPICEDLIAGRYAAAAVRACAFPGPFWLERAGKWLLLAGDVQGAVALFSQLAFEYPCYNRLGWYAIGMALIQDTSGLISLADRLRTSTTVHSAVATILAARGTAVPLPHCLDMLEKRYPHSGLAGVTAGLLERPWDSWVADAGALVGILNAQDRLAAGNAQLALTAATEAVALAKNLPRARSLHAAVLTHLYATGEPAPGLELSMKLAERALAAQIQLFSDMSAPPRRELHRCWSVITGRDERATVECLLSRARHLARAEPHEALILLRSNEPISLDDVRIRFFLADLYISLSAEDESAIGKAAEHLHQCLALNPAFSPARDRLQDIATDYGDNQDRFDGVASPF